MEGMKNVLIVTDFSEDARNAMVQGLERFGDNVTYTLLNICQEPSDDNDVLISIIDILLETSKKALQLELQFIEKTLPDKPYNIRIRSTCGDAEEVLNAFLKEEEFDFVIIGTKDTSSD